ncbi:helicase [Streptomyces triticagri]|uniref:Helicase n=1 Tax=Streptomyces triticagri TaxID=2293568 RepID=A0A372MBL1_9ACTN|nr:Rv3654c family TadE-like protein [Streptomyces triticagri]RFU88344.1 helicase [Streptomyces triticagri]
MWVPKRLRWRRTGWVARWRARRAAWPRGARTAPWRADDGVASVWAVFVVGVLAVVVGVVLLMGQAILGRHRAGGAADLVALAVADRALDGQQPACATGARVARAQRGELVRCTVRGEIADVTVRAGAGPFDAEVRSRAGPAHGWGVEAGKGELRLQGGAGAGRRS